MAEQGSASSGWLGMAKVAATPPPYQQWGHQVALLAIGSQNEGARPVHVCVVDVHTALQQGGHNAGAAAARSIDEGIPAVAVDGVHVSAMLQGWGAQAGWASRWRKQCEADRRA